MVRRSEGIGLAIYPDTVGEYGRGEDGARTNSRGAGDEIRNIRTGRYYA
jgi:hypothetical protein